MTYEWLWGPTTDALPQRQDHRAKVRKYAVRDVVDGGMSMIGAAVLWGVQVADLERWVQVAIAERDSDTEGKS